MLEVRRPFGETLDSMQLWAQWVSDRSQMVLPPLSVPPEAGVFLGALALRPAQAWVCIIVSGFHPSLAHMPGMSPPPPHTQTPQSGACWPRCRSW
jgi:hypothetical protein